MSPVPDKTPAADHSFWLPASLWDPASPPPDVSGAASASRTPLPGWHFRRWYGLSENRSRGRGPGVVSLGTRTFQLSAPPGRCGDFINQKPCRHLEWESALWRQIAVRQFQVAIAVVAASLLALRRLGAAAFWGAISAASLGSWLFGVVEFFPHVFRQAFHQRDQRACSWQFVPHRDY